MNERIKELAVKSGGFRDEGERLVSRFIEDTDMSDEIQEFAELIIQECIEQVKLELRNNTQLLSNPPQNGGVWDACNNIRKHFGVK